MADAPGTALRGALGASCGGHDCCAHGSGAAATAPAAEAGNVASWRDTLPWPCALGDGGGELLHGGDLDGDLLFAALASCGSPGAEEEWELRCKHIHTTAPSEQPGGAPQTTCHHTHVRVCKPGRARRGAGSGAAASEARGAAQPSAQGASRADAPAASAGNTAAAAEDGESSGGDDAPPERKRNREAVRKYRARKKEEEGRAAAELAAARAQVASLAADNARLRALLGQIGGLAAAGGLMAPPPPLQRF